MKKFTLPIMSLAIITAILLQSFTLQSSGKNQNLLQQPFYDNVQWHEDFAIENIEGWIMKDLDEMVPSGPFHDYPNKNTPMAFIVYNPSQTIPANTFPEFAPRTGDKAFMSIGNNTGANNDWLITRELAPHNGGIYSFYAKGTFSFFGPEEFKVGYSTTGTNESDFTFFHNPIEANFSWTQYQYTIPANAKHIAIVHVSWAYCFMVDDITFAPTVQNQAPGVISGYEAVMNMDGGLSIDLNWINPAEDANGDALASLDGIKIYRGSHPMSFEEIADLTTIEAGEESSWSDTSVEVENYYAYRLVGYNSHGQGEIWTSDFLYLGVETVPGAPNEVNFSRNEQNETVISWNEVNYGEQGGLLLDPVTGYTIIRSLGNESVTLATMHAETSFTETDAPGINLYTYQIIAHTSDENAGPPATRSYYTGMDENQQPVTWGTFQSQQVFELTRSSILSQSIYTADEIGSSGLITGLTYFSNIGAGNRTNTYKIYISKTNRNVFGTTQNNLIWEYYANQKLVFEGPVTFEPGRNAIDIAFDQPFFFDESLGENLIITVIKPLTDDLPTVTSPNFFNTPVEGMRTYYAIGFGVDLSTITTQPASWSTDEVATIPSIVTTKVTGFGSLSGTVIAGGDNSALEGVAVEITPADGSDSWQTESVLTNANGEYIVGGLLPGEYNISFFKEGYNIWETDFAITSGQNLIIDALLSDATPVLVSGTVTNQSGNPIEGAKAMLSGYSSYTAYTNASGEFALNGFGEKEYNLHVSHPLYFAHEQPFTTEDNDFALDPISLDLQAHKPMNVVAALDNGNGQVSWDIPYGLTNETGLQWGSLTQYTGWGWGGAPFTAGIRFTISDLQNMIPEDGKLTHVKAYISNQANIHIEVFEGHQAAQLIYTHAESISEEGWYTFELERAIPVDITKELWIGIRFEAGYGAYPIGIDEGPNAPQRKGSMLYDNGTWTAMSLTNKNWNIYGIVHNTVEANPMGYKVYRGLSGTDTSNWENLTPEMISQAELEDETLSDADAGIYRYGVVAHYDEELISDMTLSNEILLDVLFNINIVLQPNTGNAQGAYVSIISQDHFYETTFGVNGNETTIDGIWLGTYDISVQLENFEPVKMEGIAINEAITLEIPLTELKPAPSNLKAQQEPGSDNYLLTWTLHDSYTDDIESYPDFEKENIGNYILKDLDGMGTYTYTNFTWPGAGDPMSFMVFNPYATVPAINLEAYSGRRYLVALAGPSGQNNDWLIIPAGEGNFSFMAQSLVGSEPETFNVLYSLDGSNVGDFTAFESGTSISPPASWTRYTFDAPEGTNYVAVQYTGNDTYFLLIDDLEYQKPYHHVLSYNIYLNGDLIEDNVMENFYLLPELPEGIHLAEVEAVYDSGSSERAVIEVQGATLVDEALEEWVQLYPNPSRGAFSLELPHPADVKIITLSGAVVYHQQLPGGTNALNPGLPAGTYLVYIRTKEVNQVVKLVIH
ncbi:MAG: T9SS C-terminal target domain-containing protein [Bacteroidetes bacterium]|nr:MAG: T9SS C-terminal target domain-containing protein [Bacteroidota bacterium]